MELVEQKAKLSERQRLEVDRKKLRINLERLIKREAARNKAEPARDSHRERQQEIRETQEILHRLDSLLDAPPPDNVGLTRGSRSPSPEVQEKLDPDIDHDPNSMKLRRRRVTAPPRQASRKPSTPVDAKCTPEPAPEEASSAVNAESQAESSSEGLFIDIPAPGARPISSSEGLSIKRPASIAATANPRKSKRQRTSLAASDPQKGSRKETTPLHSTRLDPVQHATDPNATSHDSFGPARSLRKSRRKDSLGQEQSSPQMPPPSPALPQSFIHDSNVRLQLFPPLSSNDSATPSSQRKQRSRKTRRQTSLPELAFGVEPSSRVCESTDFDLPRTWVVSSTTSSTSSTSHDAEAEVLQMRSQLVRDLGLQNESHGPELQRLADGQDHVPDSQESRQGLEQAHLSVDSVVPETDFASSGERRHTDEDSDDAVYDQLVPRPAR